jgi:hypothetical protein
MHFNPFFCEMKVLFCKNEKFFQSFPQNAQRFEDNPANQGKKGGDGLCQRQPGPAEREEVQETSQQHPHQHEKPQLPPAGDAAQEEKQHPGQEGIG